MGDWCDAGYGDQYLAGSVAPENVTLSASRENKESEG